MDAINKDHFIIIPREKNIIFMMKYRLRNNDVKNILLSLKKENIIDIIEDKDYLEYGSENLVIFKMEKELIDFHGAKTQKTIYIKIKIKFNEKLPIISFHEDEIS